ncbi:hypothetical protein NUU61_000755 [Penicillium alfredii]|uniref:Protein kinase domain-containing protein n=1 Tax=Penicillium alfredii TaxID=1506179 RepID=A0A9W9GAC3_9EURO|nr:uncharacterized protein NUU61_000755 [Penicillium alfredii]KAJ5114996.1 hypothetical protein NUU61_000755 [Penicillium alfredii]
MTPASSPIPLSLHTGRDAKDGPLSGPTPVSSLTPPVTPTVDDRSTPSPFQRAPPEEDVSLSKDNVLSPLRFVDDVEICRDEQDRYMEFGRGAWSIVYKARSRQCATASTPSTPPSSPVSVSRVLAVKVPLRRDARPVLRSEALTLTRLDMTAGCEHHIVPFYGYHSESEALVMAAVPLALSTYIEDQADLARKRQPSTLTMFEPVQGPDAWLRLARKLISGLTWLHQTAGVVHGDIKPHNLLLRPVNSDANEDPFPYEPLFADFSSALDIPEDPSTPMDSTRASMSAFTPPFTAPELLSLASLTSGDITPTPSSDVFSLATTLLAAATGDLLLYPGSSNMQRLAMAREGHRIIEFTRSGMNGTRIPRNGLVERIVQPAISKDPAQRISSSEWLAVASA